MTQAKCRDTGHRQYGLSGPSRRPQFVRLEPSWLHGGSSICGCCLLLPSLSGEFHGTLIVVLTRSGVVMALVGSPTGSTSALSLALPTGRQQTELPGGGGSFVCQDGLQVISPGGVPYCLPARLRYSSPCAVLASSLALALALALSVGVPNCVGDNPSAERRAVQPPRWC